MTLPVGGAMRSSRPTIAARRADTNRGYKKTSTRISVEAVGIALLETRVEANAIAFPLPSAAQLETLTFPSTTALQRKLSIRRAVARLCPG